MNISNQNRAVMKYSRSYFQKGFSLLLVLSLFLVNACSLPERATGGSPSASDWKNGVKGQWFLASIDKENFPAEYAVKSLFEEAPPECFAESVWNLPANGRGSITFTSEGRLCAPGAVRNIQ